MHERQKGTQNRKKKKIGTLVKYLNSEAVWRNRRQLYSQQERIKNEDSKLSP
jgi:hypothetical protein